MSRLVLAGAVLLGSGLAHATQDDGAAVEGLAGHATAAPSEAADAAGSAPPLAAADSASSAEPRQAGAPPAGSGQAPPLPRFTVGWYCPAPRANPLSDLLGFGLGLLLIWGMAARRKARDARRA